MTGGVSGAALAYVFWHWKRPSIPAAEYEAHQRAFHEALATHPPDGFSHSSSSAVSGAPWANGGGDAYQDRYVIRDSAALDALDGAVLAGARRQAHDGAAAVADGGTAGLYRARLGGPVRAARHALWFAKPRRLSYEELIDACAPLVRDAGGVLWMRRMVLGPSPEVCIESAAPVAPPPGIEALALTLRPVWPA